MLYVSRRERRALYRTRSGRARHVSKGRVLESTYGSLPFHEGDYLVIHRGILHRYRFDLNAEQQPKPWSSRQGHVRWPKLSQRVRGS